jgi:hypothetical protein
LKVIAAVSHQPRAAAPLALPRRAFAADAGASWGGPDDTVLTTPRAIGRSPSLAQYLAQEFLTAAGEPPRWRERETAYRLAGDPPTRPLLSLDA